MLAGSSLVADFVRTDGSKAITGNQTINGNLTMGGGKTITLKTDLAAAESLEGASLLLLQNVRDTDRAKLMWVNHEGVGVVDVMFHDYNYTDVQTLGRVPAARHNRWEVKTQNAAYSNKLTRLSIGVGADSVPFVINHSSIFQFTNPASTPIDLAFYETVAAGTSTPRIGRFKIFLDASDHTILDLEPLPSAGTKNVTLRMMHNVGTTGTKKVIITNGAAEMWSLNAATGNMVVAGSAEIDGDLNHDGAGVGFYGVAPVARPAAYTQTYATADRTLGAYASDAENVAYTGIDNAQPGSVYAQLADLNALRIAYENLRALVEDHAQLTNAVVDDLQAVGLLQ